MSSYSLETKEWIEKKQKLHVARMNASACYLDGKLYVVGGKSINTKDGGEFSFKVTAILNSIERLSLD